MLAWDRVGGAVEVEPDAHHAAEAGLVAEGGSLAFPSARAPDSSWGPTREEMGLSTGFDLGGSLSSKRGGVKWPR